MYCFKRSLNIVVACMLLFLEQEEMHCSEVNGLSGMDRKSRRGLGELCGGTIIGLRPETNNRESIGGRECFPHEFDQVVRSPATSPLKCIPRKL